MTDDLTSDVPEDPGPIEPPPPHDLVDPSSADAAVTMEPTPPRHRRWPVAVGVVAAFAGISLLVALQLALISSLDDTRTELDETRSQLVDLEGQIGDIAASVDQVAADVAISEASAAPPTTPQTPSLPAGHLPLHVQGQQDTALGLNLAPVEGPEAYTSETIAIDPADGTKRIWMVWAHWCPYCQQELPTLSTMYTELQAAYPGIDIATVTTSIDPARGNPLDEYLDDQQFPFTVIVDDDLRLSNQMGVSAFPFWLVTDGDGTVLLRLTGFLEPARIAELAATLDGYQS